jgi:hypothetical protein
LPILEIGVNLSSWGTAIQDGLIRCYLALGEKENAVAEMKVLLDSGLERLNHPIVYVRTLYRIGLLELERGDLASGRKYLKSFLVHWGNAEWDLSEVDIAKKRLDAFN